MVMLCFLLDLRTLSPPLLRDLKQSLLQLANFYAISIPRGHKSISNSKSLLDRIGICYVVKNRVSYSTEMKVAYRPSGSFSLRDFHHAVNNLPADAFLPEFNNCVAVSSCDVHLPSVLSDNVLYSWGDDNNDVERKVKFCILSSKCCITSLQEATDKCISVYFILLEKVSTSVGALPESINNFLKNIGWVGVRGYALCTQMNKKYTILKNTMSKEVISLPKKTMLNKKIIFLPKKASLASDSTQTSSSSSDPTTVDPFDYSNDDYSRVEGPEKRGYIRCVGRMPAVKASSSSTDPTMGQMKNLLGFMGSIINNLAPNPELSAILKNMNIQMPNTSTGSTSTVNQRSSSENDQMQGAA